MPLDLHLKNTIQAKRDEILKVFDQNAKISGDNIYAISESGLFYFETEKYLQNDPERNWIINKIMIFDTEKANLIYEYFTDHDDETFAWITKDNIDYLLFPEFLGGYSIFITQTNDLQSFYTKDDPFIWQKIDYLSNSNQLVVKGCYWACPTEIITYNFNNRMQLPYPIIKRI